MKGRIEYVALAGRIREANELLVGVGTRLVDLGSDDVAFQLGDLSLQLLDIHKQLMEAFGQGPAALRRPQSEDAPEQLPF